jgi:hypothetical protein
LAYYATQRKGDSVHLPHSCIPAGGWEIKDLRQVTLGGRGKGPGTRPGGASGRDQGRSYGAGIGGVGATSGRDGGAELPGGFRLRAGRLGLGREQARSYGGRGFGPTG